MRWALVAVLGLLACGRDHDPIAAPSAVAHEAAHAAVPPPRPDQLQHVTIKALGMTCEESCPMRVRYALADIPAVYELGFDLDHEAIFVSYDAKLGTPKDVTRPMIAAILRAGFDPWLAREDWPAEAKAQVVAR
jgi:copper chaperone CopZ